MAEAIKPSNTKKKKSKNKHNNENHQDELFQENHNQNSEINDETLENRLKSLTSFINNREPIDDDQNESKNEKKSQESVTENLSTIETSASGDQYYKMIEDKVKNKIENKDESQKSFDNLNRLLDNLKTVDSIIPSTAPLIMPSAPLQETNSIKQTLFETNRLIDFNLDKIKQMNQLHYPRLSWNKTNMIKEDIKDEANLSNLEDTNHINLSIVTELTRKKNQLIELELMRFFDRDQLCKDLEVYYKCKQIQSDQFDLCLDHFITTHSVLNEFSSDFSNQVASKRKHEFYELVKDYYEARLLVNKCIRHVNEFKWECIANQMRKIWSFEKYTIESSGTCADQQRCKHELKSEKAYLNRIELQKMQVMLFELRFNLIKTGLISSQFCSKLAKCKIESYLNNFLVRFKQIDDFSNSKKLLNIDDSYININDELKHLIDILFYFNRKQMKPSLNIIENTNRKLSKPERKTSNDNNNHYYEIDDSNELQSSSAATATIDANKIESETPSNESDETNNLNEDIDDDSNNLDELFKSNVTEWLKVLCCLLINESETKRYNSLINFNSNLFIQYSNFHFENTFFLIQHLLRSPNQYIVNYSYLFQFPLLLPISGSDYLQIFKFLGLNSPQSDSLIHLYFDNYLKLFASFSYDVKYRSQFLFVKANAKNKKFNNENSNRFYDEQDANSLEASSNWQLVDLDGDLESIESVIVELKEDDLIKLYYQIPFNSIYSFLWDYLTYQNNDEFRKRYVAMKILSFLDYLSRLSIRSLIIYNKLKYKNFSKLIGKTLKDSIKFAGSIMSTKQNTNFQLHCDHFVKRIFTTIIYSPRVKSIRWTILSNLNLNSLSLNTKWLILSIMCGIDVYHPNFESIFNDINSFDNDMCQIKKKDYILQACKNDLENILSEYQENGVLLTHELLSYLRTLHFLINLNHNDIDTESLNVKYHDLINDHNTDQLENYYIDHGTQTLDIELYEFMSCVVKIIFKIAYCYETTKEICYKEGNSLLFAVCSAYPRLIGYVLHEIDIELANIGKRSLYLSDELPYSKWLPYIDCEQDLNFLEKCLLTNTTNSILFHLAVSCIDNLDFNQSTHIMSDDRFKNWLNKNQNNPHSKNLYQLLIKNGIDISKLVKIKLSIILFELHSRLTIYNYYTFNRNTNNNNNNSNLNSDLSISNLPPNISSNNIYPQLFSTDKDKEDLQTHYQKLTKEKRLGLVNWIWSTLYKMNIFVLIDSSPQFIDYLEELSYIYSKKNHNTNHHGYINRFYHIFLSHQSNQYQSIEMSTILMQQETHDDHESLVENSLKKQIPQLQFVFQPKCPLESFLTLVYTRSGHDLNYIFDHSIDLIQTILNTNKKQQNIQLTQTSYYIVFDWLENLIFKHFVEKINIKNQSTSSQSISDLMHQFRLAKQSNLTKLSQLLLTIFNSAPLNQSNTILDVYCSKIYNRLVKLENFKSELMMHNYSSNSYMEQIDSNKNNYLYIWIEILMSSIKNWHKYKNIVKIIDFLISYSFNNTSSNFFVNQNLLDELFSYVRNDFGLTKTQSSSNNSANISGDTPMSENITIQQQQNVLSNWLHPSISWLSSSLTNVVTNTANQITGTVGAAIGINGSNSSNASNNDFESYQQQLTYDKRLYKECPFIGFYLSLCEERIESQLQLWTTFRSFLIGSSDNLTGGSNLDQTTNVSNSNLLSSPSFIDSCWRKTLISINKTNNLNLSFPPQRLMLFKWCERALELPVDHPLLILYWQKFFDIYLEKEIHSNFSSSSSSSSNNKNELELKNTSSSLSAEKTHHQSSTFKLFTSTSQLNSLLKQMKKQLEMTSEHYAYECTNKQNNNNNNISNETPSAPISNYHFNEFISKLYYALSLWIDETRLHDPNLYLPALPSHYEPNLLSKIFAKQSDLWIQYIDMNRLNLNLNKIVQSGFKNDISNSIKLNKSFEISSANRKNSNHNQKINHKDDKNSIFFKQSDRLVLSLPSISQLNLKFNCALKEKFGNSIDNLLDINKTLSKDEMNLILNICENLIRNIFKYNKEVINHSLNHLLKLDEKLTNKLLIHLWHNEMCEKYVQVPCTSLINPMHQCARPAMVKFVYEIATKRDQFRQEIKQNRINHDKLISNLIEYIPANSQNDINHVEINRFPNDDIIKSMVAMNQLIKKLLKNYHITLQHQNDSNNHFDSSSQMLLTRMFYLLIDLYETQMTHPTDVLNPFKERGSSSSIPTFLSCKNDDFESFNSIIEQQSLTDSIHLYIFDLIHLIGSNFIQSISNESQIIGLSNLRRRNQQILLEKIIQKLTSTLSLSNLIERSSSSNNLSSNIINSSSTNMPIGSTPTTSSSSSSALKKQNTILLNLTRNKLLLMSLCAQYVEPDDLDLFNEFYTNILCSISSILINEAKGQTNSVDSVEMINQKFAIIIQLLSKFSYINLKKLIDVNSDQNDLTNLSTNFVEININFLMDLKLDVADYKTNFSQETQENQIQRQIIKEKNLKLIIDQCIDNFVSILDIQYPIFFEYMLKKCLEFSASPLTSKYGSKHLIKLNLIFQQQEILYNQNEKLKKEQYEMAIEFLAEYFNFERIKFRSQKRSFYSHWFIYCRELSDFYSTLFTTYFDRYVSSDLTKIKVSNISEEIKIFQNKFDKLFEILLKLYTIWIEPDSIKEAIGHSLINVKEIYENEIAILGDKNETNSLTSQGAACILFFSSFLSVFHNIFERLNLFTINNQIEHINISIEMQHACKNYALNKMFHYYYEQIASTLNSISAINDNVLDCYHKCLSKYSSSWYGIMQANNVGFQYEPDYQSINIMMELCLAPNSRLIRYLAFDIVSYLDFNLICESYFRKMEIMPMQINDLLKCWLQLLAEFCLRDSIRESNQFDGLLRPIYNQAEVLQCWSMLSDTSYSDVVLNRFCQIADYHYAFATRGTDRGLLMNLLKSAGEFYSLTDRNSISCFSSAKRRCYLKAVCHLLLKPSISTIKLDIESFQNCVINLLTDIETFSISAVSSAAAEDYHNMSNNGNDTINSLNIKHEIQLLIDECLTLISYNNDQQVSDVYRSLFESWLSSSKDSPILTHFINRISRNFDMLTAPNTSSFENYCNLLELCLDVFFETNRSNDDLESSAKKNAILLNDNLINDSIYWKCLMEEIEFRLNNYSVDLECLKHSTYLLLSLYMNQRLAILKANPSNSNFSEMLKYCEQILNSFLSNNSRPKQTSEDKFILIINKLLEIYLYIMSNALLLDLKSQVGEQLVKLSNLFNYYGEDTLSNQNPLNDNQSIGSDLLASIGFNILSKKSPFYIDFRFYSRCMSICILRQILIIDQSKLTAFNDKLFPDLNQIENEAKDENVLKNCLYKVRMTQEDNKNDPSVMNETIQFSCLNTMNKISASLPNNQTLNFSPTLSSFSSSAKSMINSFNQILKQASQQFNLIFQTKSYYNNSLYIELANYVNQNVQNPTQSQYFCLPQVYNMNRYLSAQLFKEKQYLF